MYLGRQAIGQFPAPDPPTLVRDFPRESSLSPTPPSRWRHKGGEVVASGNPMTFDGHAWTEQALQSHGQFVRRLARTLVADENEAEELAQETWLVALRQVPADVERPRSWLAGVLRRLALTRRRTELRRRLREEGAGQRADARSADREAEELELQQRVVAAVLALGPPYRDVILLRYYRGLSLAEIAGRSGSPLETVRTRLKRAHELLRETLDRDYGSRASWCVAVTALSELREPSVSALGLSKLLTFGGVIMSWKYVAVVVALAALGGTIWSLRGDEAPSGPPGGIVTPEVHAQLPAVGDDAPVEMLTADPKSARTDAGSVPEPEISEGPQTPGVWLVGRLIGSGDNDGILPRLTIESARRPSWYGDSELERTGVEVAFAAPIEIDLESGSPFEVDLTGLFARGEVTDELGRVQDKFAPVYDPEQPIEALRLQVLHDDYLPLEQQLKLDPRLFERIRGGERVELEVELRLERARSAIEGSVSLPVGSNNKPIYVALFPLGSQLEGAPKSIPLQKATCDDNGRFVLNVSRGGRAVIVAGVGDYRDPVLRPESRILEIELGERLQLPPIELTEGEILAGEVIDSSTGSSAYRVRASLVGGERHYYILNAKGRNTTLKWIDGVFELQSVEARTGKDGRFHIQGLGGREYQLTSTESGRRPSRTAAGGAAEGVPVARFDGGGLLHNAIGGMTVWAPASGVELDPRPNYAGFQLFGAGRPLAGATGRLTWATRTERRESFDRIETDELGQVLFAIGRGMELDCWVVFSAPGWKPHALLHVNDYLHGRDTFEPVELEPGPQPVSLRLLLQRSDGGQVGQAMVRLLPWPSGAPRPDQRKMGREARLQAFVDYITPEHGEFLIKGLCPGRYWCTLVPSSTSFGRSVTPWRRTSFELVVPAKAEAYHTHELGSGSHLRVTGVQGTGLAASFLELQTPEGWRVSAQFGDSTGGAFQTTEPLDPGDYVLRINASAWKPIELPFAAVDGEVIELELELQPR